MATAMYRTVLQMAEALSREEQLQLVEELHAHAGRAVPEDEIISVLELEGLGQELWEGIDAQEYVNQERASWER